MVARGGEGCRQTRKDAAAVVMHLAHLAVHDVACADHLAAKRLSQRLMPQTNAQKGDTLFSCCTGQIKADACLIGAFANLLFVSAYVALLARPYLPITRPSVGSRTYKASVFMACVAAAGTLGVLVPLAFGSESFRVSIGYMLWVGSAALLVFAARRLSISDLT